MTLLVRCGDGHLAPSCLVCSHVMDGSASKWIRLPSPEGEEVDDCLCESCFNKGVDGLEPGIDLACVCMHCLRNMIAATSAVVVAASPGECVRLGFFDRADQ